MDNTSDLKIDDENNEWDLNRGIGMSMFQILKAKAIGIKTRGGDYCECPYIKLLSSLPDFIRQLVSSKHPPLNVGTQAPSGKSSVTAVSPYPPRGLNPLYQKRRGKPGLVCRWITSPAVTHQKLNFSSSLPPHSPLSLSPKKQIHLCYVNVQFKSLITRLNTQGVKTFRN